MIIPLSYVHIIFDIDTRWLYDIIQLFLGGTWHHWASDIPKVQGAIPFRCPDRKHEAPVLPVETHLSTPLLRRIGSPKRPSYWGHMPPNEILKRLQIASQHNGIKFQFLQISPAFLKLGACGGCHGGKSHGRK